MANATQTETLDQVKENTALDIRVSMPAKIISFDAATRTAQVEICMQMIDSDDNPINYPPLTDCPCMFTRGGGFHVSHPYKQGDSGIVLFSDRCIDGWFETGGTAPPLDYRIHSMSDAYFIGAADNMTNVAPIINDAMFIGKDDNSAGLQINGDGSVIIKGTSLTIEPVTNAAQINVNGKPVDGHDHTGVQRGSAKTDPF